MWEETTRNKTRHRVHAPPPASFTITTLAHQNATTTGNRHHPILLTLYRSPGPTECHTQHLLLSLHLPPSPLLTDFFSLALFFFFVQTTHTYTTNFSFPIFPTRRLMHFMAPAPLVQPQPPLSTPPHSLVFSPPRPSRDNHHSELQHCCLLLPLYSAISTTQPLRHTHVPAYTFLVDQDNGVCEH